LIKIIYPYHISTNTKPYDRIITDLFILGPSIVKRTHLYLRASTKEQDAHRAKNQLEEFAADRDLQIHDVYSENITGTSLARPELHRLLEAAIEGDVLLVESVDRLSRLSQKDWHELKHVIKSKGIRIVVADLPTSHQLIDEKGVTGQIMAVINDMLIDLMATMARLDQEKRIERIRQGLANKIVAEPAWKPKGKSRDLVLWEKVKRLLEKHSQATTEEIAKMAECGVATVYRIKRSMK
jgi:DNA invertase Pin-like site-specific DNA recombinase